MHAAQPQQPLLRQSSCLVAMPQVPYNQNVLRDSCNHPYSPSMLEPRFLLLFSAATQKYWAHVKARPAFMLLLPLVTFAVLCTCGVLGVVLGANKYEQELRDRAQSAAIDWVGPTHQLQYLEQQ